MITKEKLFSVDLDQILTTAVIRECMETSENLYVYYGA